ncbi:hypothetical protein JI58_04965 [Marinosulfonomonas sp. PRT-SC04]|nr:hypothetical protein JI58_04965 [Marinosulfonomonas sp. PRT-SC04]
MKSCKNFRPHPFGKFPLGAFPFAKFTLYINAMTIFPKLFIALFALTTLPFSQTAIGQETTVISRPASSWSKALISSAHAKSG